MSAIFPLTRLLLLPAVLLLFACDGDEKQPPPARKQPTTKPSNVYTVKSGDTLYAIGVKYKLNYQTLAQLNRIAPPYTLAVGQALKLPMTTTTLATTEKTAAKADSRLTYSANLTESEFKKQQAIATAEATEPNLDVVHEEKSAPTQIYVVQKNETLYSISRRFGLTPHSLAALNNITAPEQLHAGQSLTISAKPSATKLATPSADIAALRRRLPSDGKILKNFRSSGNRGIEIGGKLGQAIKAVAAGRVVAVKPAIYGYGVFIVIQHPNGYLSSYANNSVALVQIGEQVSRGQIIAQMGQIGRNMPSVEFEVRKDGQLSDPLPFLAQQK